MAEYIWLVEMLGLCLAVLALIGFHCQKVIFGIKPVIFEFIAVALLGFSFGFQGAYLSMVICGIGTVFAVFIDPYIWKVMIKDINLAKTRVVSFIGNGAVFLVGICFCILGLYLR